MRALLCSSTLTFVNPRNLLIVFASVATLLSTNQADAQSRAVDSKVSTSLEGERSRFAFGMSIGRGSIAIECPICDGVAPLTEALSVSVHAGYMVTPRLALIGEYWSVRYNNRGSDWFPDSQDHAVLQHMATIGGQLWLTKRLYIRAGIGLGRHSSDSLYTKPDVYESDDGFLRAAQGMMGTESGSRTTAATTIGAGFEFAHTKNFAVDVQFRVGRTATNVDKFSVHNTGITFGVAWY